MKEPTPQFNLRLTTSQIEECLLHMLRDPELFQYARQNLQPLDFSPLGELRYVLVWQSALNVAERMAEPFPYKVSRHASVRSFVPSAKQPPYLAVQRRKRSKMLSHC